MKTYQDKFGNEGYGAYGQGNFIQTLPQPQYVTYGDFSGGLNTKDSREDIQPNSSPNSLDVEVTLRDRLRRVPGTTTVETLTRNPAQLVLHASLDYTSELVMFDAPFIGIKTGDTTVWTDVGLPEASRRFAYVNFGGVLLFSNGRVGMYAKEAGESEVTLVDNAPAAHTFASFAGRVFAGASIIGGNREPLGISWSGASSDYNEWEPFSEGGVLTGAGFELLIDDMAQGNYIVALRTMGLDFLAIILRNSIWIGRKTNQRARPADFQPRVSGVGAVNEASCVVTRFGVVHLHDSGVYLFDGNNSILISEQVNSELLPLDRSQLGLYSASYNPTSKQVYLFTPTCTWVYDLERQRWHKRSLIATGASIFAAQIAAITWAELTGTWGDRDEMWEDYKAKETGTPAYLFLGPTGGQLAREDSASSSNFGTAMEPYWEFPRVLSPRGSRYLFVTKEVTVKYEGEGTVVAYTPDKDGNLVARRTVNLSKVLVQRDRVISMEHSGQGVGLRLDLAGTVEISRVEIKVLPSGPRIESPLDAVLLLHDEGIIVNGYFNDWSQYPLGPLPSDWVVFEPTSNTIGSWTIIQEGSNKLLRMDPPGAFIGSAAVLAIWSGVGNQGDLDVLTKYRTADRESEVGPLLRTLLTSSNTGYLGAHRGLAGTQRGNISYDNSTQVTFSVGPAWVANTWFYERLHASGNAITIKIWQEGTTEPSTPTATYNNVIGTRRTVGAIGLKVLIATGGNARADFAFISYAVGSAAVAPDGPPVVGWIVLPNTYTVRFSAMPEGYSIRAAGTTVTEQDGVVILTLATTPVNVELLDTSGDVVKSISAPANQRSYQVELYYE
jgi:hypothetical protein